MQNAKLKTQDLTPLLFGTGLFTGYSPIASGTVATFLSAAIYWWLMPQNFLFYLIIFIVITILAIPVSSKLEQIFGQKDDRRITIDEIVGFWAAMAFLPKQVFYLIAGILLFRLFDVWKPFFIRKLQKLPAGWGVVADDIAAGLLTNIILQVSRLFFTL